MNNGTLKKRKKMKKKLKSRNLLWQFIRSRQERQFKKPANAAERTKIITSNTNITPFLFKALYKHEVIRPIKT